MKPDLNCGAFTAERTDNEQQGRLYHLQREEIYITYSSGRHLALLIRISLVHDLF